MGFYDAIRIGASSAVDSAFTVDRSLRFNDDDNAYLNRTPSGASNRTTFTLSAWVKRASNLDEFQRIFEAGADTSNRTYFTFDGDDKLEINHRDGGSEAVNLTTTARFRDISAWYHIVLAVDTTQSTSSNRIKIYVNGTQQTDFDTSSYPSSSKELDINSTAVHYIGRSVNNTSKLDGYLAEVNFIDGQQLTPSSFAETNATTGQWNPIDTSGLTFGTNGFRLQFADNSGTSATTLGKDSSGNGNNFTPNNFSVSAGIGNDSVEDTPTNNWATLNPLHHRAISTTFSNGNLQAVLPVTTATGRAHGNFVVYSGKWYWEAKYTGSTGNFLVVGVCSADGLSFQRGVRGADGELVPNTGTVSVSFATNDVIMVALDVDNGKWYIGKNGSYMLSGDPVNGTGFVHSGLVTTYNGLTAFFQNPTSSGSQTIAANFGQQGFTYTPPTDFKALNSANLPDPTILLPNKHFDTLLYTGNGGTQSITGLDYQPDWVWIKRRNGTNSHQVYDAVRGAGKNIRPDLNNTEVDQTAFNSFDSNGFELDGGTNSHNSSGNTYVAWNWNAGNTDGKTYTVKVVSDGGNKYRFDDFGTSAVTLDLAEGGTYIFDGSDSSMASHPIKLSETSNGTHGGGSSYNTGVTYLLDGASVTESAYVSGYASATTRQLKIVVAASAPQLFYFCHYHSGMGGAINTNSTLGSSNFDGTIQSVTKVNASAGFSIAKYTGTGSNGTIGHGLGVKPDSYWVKRRTGGLGDWMVFHKDLGSTKNQRLNENLSNFTQATIWNNTDPTSSVVNVGTSSAVNGTASGSTYVMYCFSEVAGYSKFGSYAANGNSSDGPFVFLGFRPAWIMFKSITGTGQDWIIHDIKRDDVNYMYKRLKPNNNTVENTSSTTTARVDFLSNGFKVRGNGNLIGASGKTYIYFAFAESPFKNARAR